MIAAAANARVSPSLLREPLVGNYFVAVYPPFSCWQGAGLPAVTEAINQQTAGSPLGIYIHIPFCQKKCNYCYYLSYVGAESSVVEEYLDTLISELKLYSTCSGVRNRPVSFVYFGGGTPSLLQPEQVRRLFAGLKGVLPWSGAREVTFECAPRSVTRELLSCLRDEGVTRLSMGVQSFDNAVLRLNGRVHSAEDAVGAFRLMQGMGFEWVNLDLMAGLMGEVPESWESSVRQMIELGPDSVTLYQTEIPYNTALYQQCKTRTIPAAVVSWGEKRQRLSRAFDQLACAGYTVVSAYSAVKDPEQRQFQYQNHLWRGGDMLGLGVASFSYVGGVHFQNSVNLESYATQVRQGQLPLKRAFPLDARDQFVREFILQLKWGEVYFEEFRRKFDRDIRTFFAPQLDAMALEGFLVLSSSSVRLTRSGLLCVDRLLPAFYDPQYQAQRYT